MILKLGKKYVTNRGDVVTMAPKPDHDAVPSAAFHSVEDRPGVGFYSVDGCYTYFDRTHERSIAREYVEPNTVVEPEVNLATLSPEDMIKALRASGYTVEKKEFSMNVSSVDDFFYGKIKIVARSLMLEIKDEDGEHVADFVLTFDEVDKITAAVAAARV